MLFAWKRRSFAQRGEDLAAKHLKRSGYKIVERNARLGHYEIDIIAREGDTVAFVEGADDRGVPRVEPLQGEPEGR